MLHVLGSPFVGYAFAPAPRRALGRGTVPVPSLGTPQGRLYSHQESFDRTYSGWGSSITEPPEPWTPNGYGAPWPRWVYRRGLWEDTRGRA